MLTAKMTSKGQVTIPKNVRDRLGLSQGEELQFCEEKGVFYIQKSVKKSPFDKWVGHLTQLPQLLRIICKTDNCCFSNRASNLHL